MAGYFISFEGIEGSGKSTVARALAQHFRDLGFPVTLTREPGGTEVGERIREILLSGNNAGVCAEAEALLFAASRAQIVSTIIRPALARGELVIVDRFTDSSLAYQWGGRGLPLEAVEALQSLATGGIEPDLKLLLDVPVQIGLLRRFASPELANRIDRETLAFHERVRGAYHELASGDPQRWRTIDASRPQSEVWAEVLATMDGLEFAKIGRSVSSAHSQSGTDS